MCQTPELQTCPSKKPLFPDWSSNMHHLQDCRSSSEICTGKTRSSYGTCWTLTSQDILNSFQTVVFLDKGLSQYSSFGRNRQYKINYQRSKIIIFGSSGKIYSSQRNDLSNKKDHKQTEWIYCNKYNKKMDRGSLKEHGTKISCISKCNQRSSIRL